MTKKLKLPPIKIDPLTPGQHNYLMTLDKNIITFCAGLPGTGKTFIAVLNGIHRIQKGLSCKLIITRPIVEAGENLGFLPGSIEEKVRPFIHPIFDSLKQVLDNDIIDKMVHDRIIEICPLAYIRGRTFRDSYMILDEAQNATLDQIKMFMTRIGTGTRMVLCGDPRQKDLKQSGFIIAMDYLNNMDKIGITTLGKDDIVRNNIIADVVEKLEQAEADIEIRKYSERNYRKNGYEIHNNCHMPNGKHKS